MPTRFSGLRQWLPLVGLTFSAFIFNTSEFVPIGLLTGIATDLHITEAHAGMLISWYAWAVALLSLPLMLLCSRMEFRRLLLITLAVFVVSHVASALSSGFVSLLCSRLGVACSHAVFWSIASPLAVRIAPQGRRATALGLIVTGTSVAMIAGLPLGRIIGLHVGWRMAFLSVGVVAFLVLGLLWVVFPKVPVRHVTTLRNLPPLLRNRPLMGIYLLTLLLVAGHYTGYSYIEPFLGQVSRFSDSVVTFLLTLFGAAGLLGSWLFSHGFEARPRPFVLGSVALVCGLLLLLGPLSGRLATVLPLCLCWGMAVTAFNLTYQAEVIRLAPEATPVAMSIYSGIFNVGIGSGAWIGAAVCASGHLDRIGLVGGLIALLAVLYCGLRLMPQLIAARRG